MASTPKKARRSESRIGYLHNISPLKTSKSNTKYFNATIQTKNAYEEIVSFRAESFQAFVDMAKARTPVCLQDVDTIPSYKNPGGFDLKFTSYSKLESPKETVTFPFQQHSSGVTDKKIKDVLETCTRFQKVNITAKVHQIMEEEEIKQNLVKTSSTISDDTGYIQLTIWNEQIGMVKSGQTYYFTNLSVREFNGDITLTTTVTTSIKKKQDLEMSVTVPSEEENWCSIKTIEVNNTINCIHCKTPIKHTNTNIVKCEKCGKKMLKANLINTIVIKVTVDSKEYDVNSKMLDKVVPNWEIMSVSNIEDDMLEHVMVNIKRQKITSLKRI